MTNENIIGVCVSRDTSMISVFNVNRTEDEIENIKLIHANAISTDNVIDYTKRISKSFDISMCLVESDGFGINVYDKLLNDKEYNISCLPIHHNSANNDQKTFMNFYNENKLIDFEKYFTQDLIQKYMITKVYISNGESQKFNGLKDIAFLISNIITCKEQYKHKKRKDIIENSLTEIINVCMDTLKETNPTNKNEIDKLVHIMDKANYIRGQY